MHTGLFPVTLKMSFWFAFASTSVSFMCTVLKYAHPSHLTSALMAVKYMRRVNLYHVDWSASGGLHKIHPPYANPYDKIPSLSWASPPSQSLLLAATTKVFWIPGLLVIAVKMHTILSLLTSYLFWRKGRGEEEKNDKHNIASGRPSLPKRIFLMHNKVEQEVKWGKILCVSACVSPTCMYVSPVRNWSAHNQIHILNCFIMIPWIYEISENDFLRDVHWPARFMSRLCKCYTVGASSPSIHLALDTVTNTSCHSAMHPKDDWSDACRRFFWISETSRCFVHETNFAFVHILQTYHILAESLHTTGIKYNTLWSQIVQNYMLQLVYLMQYISEPTK